MMRMRAPSRKFAWLGLVTFAACAPHAAPTPKHATTTSDAHSLAGKRARALDASRARALDAFANDAATKLHVPGAAIAVLAGGRVAHETVVGVRELGAHDAVSSRTLFMIGSITKSVTTMMEAVLVDQGKVAWNTPLTTLLPKFAVDDPARTEELVLWHASCACSGLGSPDIEDLFEFAKATPEMRVDEMRRMKPIAPLGAQYIYSNAMVALGGYAAAHAARPNLPLAEAYAETLKATVLDPIGMASSTLDFEAAAHADHAMPHAAAIDGSIAPFPLDDERNVVPMEPAGGVWSNLLDMERYVLTELRDGVTPEGKRIASEANVRERRKLRVKSDGDDGYGLGLDVGSYDGVPMIGHDGGALGYGTSMLMLPESSVAIVILTNVRNGGPFAQLPFNRVVERKVSEMLFDGAEEKSSAMLEAFVTARRDFAAKLAEGVERDPPPAWARSIAGTYTNPILGTVVVREASRGGVLDAGEWKSTFGRRVEKDGSVKLVLVDPPLAGGAFAVKGDTLTVETSSGDLILARTR